LIAEAYPHSHVYALCTLAGLLSRHDSRDAQSLLRQGEHEARALGDPFLVRLVLEGLATQAARTGEWSSARDLLEESLSFADDPQRASSLTTLATVELCDGALDRAHELLQEARDLAERDEWWLMHIDLTSAYVELLRGKPEEAEVYLTSARQEADESGAGGALAAVLLGEAALRVRRDQIEPAIETWSRADALVRDLGIEWDHADRHLIERLLEPLRSVRSADEFERCWSAGQTSSGLTESVD
jgi:tetratricopeptide (TPR) repeat protein